MREPILDYQTMLDITEKVKEVTGLDIPMTIQPPHIDIIAALLDIIEEQASLLAKSQPQGEVTNNGNGHEANEEHAGDTTDSTRDATASATGSTTAGESAVTTADVSGTTTADATTGTDPNASPAS